MGAGAGLLSVFCDFGFLMVSSTESTRQAASEAAVRAFFLTIEGSQTQASRLSATSSLLISTPYHLAPNENRKVKLSINRTLELYSAMSF